MSPFQLGRYLGVEWLDHMVKMKVKVAQSWSGSLRPHGLYSPWNSPSQNTGMGSLSLLQGIFPTKGSNPGLPHCRQILYQLSHKGSPDQMGDICLTFKETAKMFLRAIVPFL